MNHAPEDGADRRDKGHDRSRQTQPSDPAANACSMRATPSSNAWRNAIEGTISELVRSHGLRRARYKGFAKADLQNQLIAAACNIKRWFRKLLETAFEGQKEDLGLSAAFPWSVLAAFSVQIDPWSFPQRRHA